MRNIFVSATKIDLREDPRNLRPLITTEEGEEFAQKIGARKFIECSSKDNVAIEEVIHESIRAYTTEPKVEVIKKESCFACPQS